MKTQIALHRCNTRASLTAVQPGWGVEMDLRSDLGQNGKLHLSHEAWERGEDFDEWLQEFR